MKAQIPLHLVRVIEAYMPYGAFRVVSSQFYVYDEFRFMTIG